MSSSAMSLPEFRTVWYCASQDMLVEQYMHLKYLVCFCDRLRIPALALMIAASGWATFKLALFVSRTCLGFAFASCIDMRALLCTADHLFTFTPQG